VRRVNEPISTKGHCQDESFQLALVLTT